jgi:hypothetical protein
MKTFTFIGILMVTITTVLMLFAGTAAAADYIWSTPYNNPGYGTEPTWCDGSSGPSMTETYVYPANISAVWYDSRYCNAHPYQLPVTSIRVKAICDQNGQNCKTVSTGWGGFALATPDGSQTNVISVNNSANVGVGTTNPQSKFAVNGTITAKEVKVTQTGWSDYVFAEDYRLLTIDELAQYVSTEKHLPGIPAAKEVEEKGLAVADMLSKQMQKNEELSLYLIQLKKENDELKTRITALEQVK